MEEKNTFMKDNSWYGKEIKNLRWVYLREIKERERERDELDVKSMRGCQLRENSQIKQ